MQLGHAPPRAAKPWDRKGRLEGKSRKTNDPEKAECNNNFKKKIGSLDQTRHLSAFSPDTTTIVYNKRSRDCNVITFFYSVIDRNIKIL